MRVYLLLSHDVVFKPMLLYQFLMRCKDNVVGVGEVKHLQRTKNIKKKSSAAGTRAFWGIKGVICLATTIIFRKITSAFPFPKYIRSRSTVKRVAQSFGVQYHLVSDVNDKEYMAFLRELNLDLILSFQHQIFRDELLALPNICCINCHPSKLPKYRGVKPIFWAMKNNEKEIGVTVHVMSKDIDKGLIIAQDVFPIAKDSTLLENYYKAYCVCPDIIIKALDQVKKGEFHSVSLNKDEEAVYYNEPSKKDIEEFRNKGLKVI